MRSQRTLYIQSHTYLIFSFYLILQILRYMFYLFYRYKLFWDRVILLLCIHPSTEPTNNKFTLYIVATQYFFWEGRCWIKHIILEKIISLKQFLCPRLLIILTIHSIYLYISKLMLFIENRIELSTKPTSIVRGKKCLEQHESKCPFEYKVQWR